MVYDSHSTIIKVAPRRDGSPALVFYSGGVNQLCITNLARTHTGSHAQYWRLQIQQEAQQPTKPIATLLLTRFIGRRARRGDQRRALDPRNVAFVCKTNGLQSEVNFLTAKRSKWNLTCRSRMYTSWWCELRPSAFFCCESVNLLLGGDLTAFGQAPRWCWVHLTWV